jgi:hypothetical protein
MDKAAHIAQVEKGTFSQGKKYLLKFLNGERLTQGQAIMAHCYGCMGFFQDGRIDCGSEMCSLRPFMIYNPNLQKKTDDEREDTTESNRLEIA